MEKFKLQNEKLMKTWGEQAGVLTLWWALAVGLFLALGCQPEMPHAGDPWADWPKPPAELIEMMSGQERGNGMDFYAYEDGHAWFTDNARTIRYCYQVSPDFGVTEDFVKQELSGALTMWEGAAGLYNLQVNHKVKIANQYEAMAACDGSEDLRFLFGVEDSAVRALHFPKHKVAAAVLSSYDEEKGWGKGFVWIANSGSVKPRGRLSWSTSLGTMESWEDHKDFPNWSWSYNLKGILLHELGHINGWDHIPNTIMAEDIYVRMIIKEEQVREVMLGQIAQYWDLIMTLNPENIHVNGSLGMPQLYSAVPEHDQVINALNADHSKRREILFEKMVGRAAVGQVNASFKLNIKHESGNCRYFLTLTDAEGSTELCIRAEEGLSLFSGPAKGGMAVDIGSIFKIATKTDFDVFTFVQSYSAQFSMTSATGEKYLVSLDFNLTQFERFFFVSPIVIKLFDGLTSEVLFTAKTPIPQFPRVRWKL